MPLYNSPMVPPQLLQNGVPAYLLGLFNMLRGEANANVTNVASTTTVATVTVQVNQGPIPQVGDLVTIYGTSQGAGQFNVTRAAITGVTINTGTNAGTVTFALAGSAVSSVADGGGVIFEPAETPEALVNNSFSVPVVVQPPRGDSQFTLPLAVTFPTMPTAVTVTLQRAIRDIASEYTNTNTVVTVAASAYTAGPVVQATLERGYVYRLSITGLSGAGTVIAKVG